MSLSLETDRLLLRRWRTVDLVPFAAICADPEVMKYIADGKPRTLAQSSQSINKMEAEWEENGFGLFAVELKRTGQLIGFCGLSIPHFLPEILPAVEIGWRLARPNWGKGLASEAAHAALAFGLKERGLTNIVSICHKDNKASERIMQKLALLHDRDTIEPKLGIEVKVYRFPMPL